MIQTVTGAIKKMDFGTILMHEHISCESLPFGVTFGDMWLDKSKLKVLASDTLKKMKQKHSLGLMVDGTPIDTGRDVLLLKEVSKLSGVKIVTSTGFYCLPSIEAFNNTPEDIASFVVYECKNGIRGTDIKPGILKCATGNAGLTKENMRKMTAMAIVQKETKLPLYVHCEHYEDIAFKQLDLLLDNAANSEKIIIGHTAIRPDSDYLERILQKGCYICMDQGHCYPNNLKDIAKTLVELCKKGYSDKILLSNDYCIHSDFGFHNKNGLHLNDEQHVQKLEYLLNNQHNEYIYMGGNERDWNIMLCKNPLDVLDV